MGSLHLLTVRKLFQEVPEDSEPERTSRGHLEESQCILVTDFDDPPIFGNPSKCKASWKPRIEMEQKKHIKKTDMESQRMKWYKQETEWKWNESIRSAMERSRKKKQKKEKKKGKRGRNICPRPVAVDKTKEARHPRTTVKALRNDRPKNPQKKCWNLNPITGWFVSSIKSPRSVQPTTRISWASRRVLNQSNSILERLVQEFRDHLKLKLPNVPNTMKLNSTWWNELCTNKNRIVLLVSGKEC